MPCCAAFSDRAGEWYFPDGNIIPGPPGNPTSFSRTRGDDGIVNLNRLNNVIMPTGLFCCEVPDALNVMQRRCANIGKLVGFVFALIMIDPSLTLSFSF